MKIHPFDLAPVSAADFVCRQSRFWTAFGLAFALIFTGAGIWIMFNKSAACIGWGWVSLGGLYGAVMFRRTIMVFSPANWLLRWDGQRMLIRLTATYSRKTRDRFVLEIPRSDIEWVRRYQFTSITKGVDGAQTFTSRQLEVKTSVPTPVELANCLRQANQPVKWKGFTASTDLSIVLNSDDLIHIAWMSSTCVVAPGLKKTLAVLGRDLQVADAKDIVSDTTRDEKDLKKMDDQILAMAQAGQTIQAVKLARKRYGFSLTDAKQFVDELRNPTPPAQNR